ncbi:MAG: hypothetical protein IH945_09270 [Armatimonadetes bacterium]|nr:hypothetical protein [Armatimonadota bacterium]
MERKRPKAVAWYEVYCHAFAALNLLTAWEGLQVLRDPHGIILRVPFLSDLVTDQETLDSKPSRANSRCMSEVRSSRSKGILARVR